MNGLRSGRPAKPADLRTENFLGELPLAGPPARCGAAYGGGSGRWPMLVQGVVRRFSLSPLQQP